VEMVQTRCLDCGYRFQAPLNSRWPIRCPDCKQKKVVPLAVCMECAHVFAVENPLKEGIRCPKCGSSHWKLITREVNPEEVKRAVEAKGDSKTPRPRKEALKDLL